MESASIAPANSPANATKTPQPIGLQTLGMSIENNSSAATNIVERLEMLLGRLNGVEPDRPDSNVKSGAGGALGVMNSMSEYTTENLQRAQATLGRLEEIL